MKALDKTNLDKFVELLSKEFNVYSITDTDFSTDFDNNKALEILKPIKSAKEIVFPQTEQLFKFDLIEKKIIVNEKQNSTNLMLWIKPCDVRGINILKKVFEKDVKDVYFASKLNNTIFVGLACNNPSRNCFCTSVGITPYYKEGMDVFATSVDGVILFEALTEKGKEVLEKVNSLLRDATEDEVEKAKEIHLQAESKVKKYNFDTSRLTWDSDVWRISEICLSCGICTYLCPTCHCFDIIDENYVYEGERIRVWDSCMYSEYTLQASGHNPRAYRLQRLRNRIMHKFVWFKEMFDEYACTGCGRCISYCPVNISLIEILGGV